MAKLRHFKRLVELLYFFALLYGDQEFFNMHEQASCVLRIKRLFVCLLKGHLIRMLEKSVILPTERKKKIIFDAMENLKKTGIIIHQE